MLQKEEKNLSPKQRLEKKKKTRVYKSYNTIVVVRAEGKTEDNFFKEFFGKTKNMPIAERNAVLNNIIPSIQLKPDEDEVILADIKNKKFSTIYAKLMVEKSNHHKLFTLLPKLKDAIKNNHHLRIYRSQKMSIAFDWAKELSVAKTFKQRNSLISSLNLFSKHDFPEFFYDKIQMEIITARAKSLYFMSSCQNTASWANRLSSN